MNLTTKLLTKICERAEWESEFIDLLSQLEYVGLRKIVKGLNFECVNFESVQHASEEALHAYLLKRVAVQRGISAARSWTEGLFAKNGWEYFQTLDHKVCESLSDRELHYPAVSWVIEERVLELYPAYLEVTQDEALKTVLRTIVSQEKRHGEQFDAIQFPEGFRESAKTLENTLWLRFCRECEQILT